MCFWIGGQRAGACSPPHGRSCPGPGSLPQRGNVGRASGRTGMPESEKGTFLTWGPAHGGLRLGHGGARLPGPKDPLHKCLGAENPPSGASSVSQQLIPTLHPHSLNTLKDGVNSGGLGPLCVVFLARGDEEGEVADRRSGTLNSGESLGTLQ